MADIKNLKITLKDLNNNALFPKTDVSAVQGLDEKISSMVNAGIAANDAMVFKGTLGTGGTITTLPDVAFSGWTYRVIESGTYASQKCEVGDLVICVGNNSSNGVEPTEAYWTVVQTNIDGAVISEDYLAEDVVVLGAGGLKVKTDATLTIGTEPNKYVYIENGKFKEGTLTAATADANGLMSKEDKKDFDDIKQTVGDLKAQSTGDKNLNAYSYFKVDGTTVSADKEKDTLYINSGTGITLSVSTLTEGEGENEKTYGVLTINGHVYSEATSAVLGTGVAGEPDYVAPVAAKGGLMSASDKEKLDKLSEALIIGTTVKPSVEAEDLVSENSPLTTSEGKLTLNLGTGLSTETDGKLVVDTTKLELAGTGLSAGSDGKLSLALATSTDVEIDEDTNKVTNITENGLGLVLVGGKLASTLLYEVDGAI